MSLSKTVGVMGQSVRMLPDGPAPFSVAQTIAMDHSIKGLEDAFFVMDVGQVFSQFQFWMSQLPRVQPHYAVKCNSEPLLLNILANLGCGFDCASKKEMEIVFDACPLLPPQSIIYAHPCKTRSHIKAARERNVTMMTFDNEEELYKIKMTFPEADLILRINVGDPTAVCVLNVKFGCDPVVEGPALIKVAADLGLKVIGVSFHVGSGCRDPTAYAIAIEHADSLFDIGVGYGHDMRLLDIGGGFPGEEAEHSFFQQIASTVNRAIDRFFPPCRNVRVVAEPGRFFACAAYKLCCNIIAKTKCSAYKITKQEDDKGMPGYMYYMNDGVYGSFNCILYDHINAVPTPLFDNTNESTMAAVWGPTCDGLDLVMPQTRLPIMEEGDWLIFHNMGAYTLAAGSEFNGFPRPTVHYYAQETMFDMLQSVCKIHCINEEYVGQSRDDDIESLASSASALTTDDESLVSCNSALTIHDVTGELYRGTHHG